MLINDYIERRVGVYANIINVSIQVLEVQNV